MKKQTRLYNVLFPAWIWALLLFPVCLFVIVGNLVIDCLVLFLTLLALKHAQKGAVMGKLWWKLWLLGYAADLVGAAWMLLGWLLSLLPEPLGPLFEDALMSAHMLRPWTHPLTFCWTLAGVAVAGVCIYFFDKRAMRKCELLDARQKHIIALTMAVVTAPWLFFVPLY